ncbi:hypothetical protein [Neotabrizicola sp. VNH66]|uniref:hypothetical protein n=1 Tax=Neotabrizicola sp. VNH66 TaxID=3400918 RepID=UPI003BFADD9A
MNRLPLVLFTSAVLLAGPALSQTPSTVTVEITFSEKALAELTSRGEAVTVSGYWMGDPAPGATLPVNEIGTIFLLTEDLTLWPGPVTVTLGSALASAPVDQVVEPMLNVNVYSARWTSDDNLLDCGLVDDLLSKLTAAPQKMQCKLIGE